MRVMKKLVGGLLLILATSANAAISLVPSDQNLFVATTGNVSAIFLGSEASFRSELYLVGNPTPLFNSKTSSFLDEVNANFAAGTELQLALFVKNTAKVYYSGLASNNADNTLHFAFFDLGNNSVLVGIEDLWKGGDKDYNEMTLLVRNVRIGPVPEPEVYMSMLLGLGLLAGASRRLKS